MKIADVFIGYGDEFKEVQYKPYAVCKWKKCSVVGIYMDQLFIVASDTVWRGYRY